MITCCDDCIPCCDFCVHAEHEIYDGSIIGGPIGCTLHPDKKHQDTAEACGYCEDFHCFRAKGN